jgi:two-component system nitrogen regulation response regulator GlnG
MLLRVLETGEMYPVGGGAPVATDVRLVAATDADLEERIRDGRFKAPLLHRLAGYEIRLPPLRERREDIGVLFYHFARQELEAIGEAHRLAPGDPHAEPWLPASLAAQLVRAAWPGNVRQLRNVARQMVIGSRGRARAEIDATLAQELGNSAAQEPRRPGCAVPGTEEAGVGLRRKPSEVTEAETLAALRESGWDLQAAADRLGIPRPSMYRMIERCPGIRTAGDLSAEEITACFRACGGDLEAMVRRLQVSGRALKRRLKELGLARRG